MRFNTMLRVFLGVSLALLAFQPNAWATAPITVIFDEYGNLYDQTSRNILTPIGNELIDPLTSVNPLAYIIYANSQGTFPATAGDVLIIDDAGISDVLRFETVDLTGKGIGNLTGLQNVLFVYSDNTDLDPGPPVPADVGLPTSFQGNARTASEVSLAPEFPSYAGVVYHAGFFSSGQPGTIPGITPTYEFISDVPEPCTLIVWGLLMGTVAVFGVVRSRARRAA